MLVVHEDVLLQLVLVDVMSLVQTLCEVSVEVVGNAELVVYVVGRVVVSVHVL